MSGKSKAPCCGHAADEHSVYGCVDGCACEKRPDLPPRPVNGPATYRGIPVPDDWGPVGDLDDWKQGVDAALDVAVPLVDDFIDSGDCSLDHHGYCQEHGWFGEEPCPNKRAQRFIATTKERGEG